MSTPPPRCIGRYTLTRRLGVGGMGEVWMGRREALGGAAKRVAIKLMSPEKAENAAMRAMFLEEARLSMLLHGANIVQVFDADETEEQLCYMVMEWVEGLDLAQLVASLAEAGERLSDVQIAFIVGEVLKALALAHELRVEGVPRTVIHRDVSPQNVMISVHGEVKLMDFGIARLSSDDTSGLYVKGKLRYMPPEQLRGETRRPTLDLFAVGAILHELLEGVKFRGQVVDDGQLIGMVIDGSHAARTRPVETIPQELEALRQGLLEPRPEARIASARAAFRQLSAWPGYRDVRFELDELVRRMVDRGKGSTPAVSNQDKPTASSVIRRETIDSRPSVHTYESGQGTAPAHSRSSGTVWRIDPTITLETSAPTVVKIPRRAVARAGGAGLLACVIGGALAWRAFEVPPTSTQASTDEAEPKPSSDEAEPKPSSDEAEPKPSSDEAEPKPSSDAELDPPAREPTPEPEAAPVEREPTPEPEPEPEPVERVREPEASVEPEAEAKVEAEPVRVSLVLAGGTTWAEVRVNRRTYELDAFGAKRRGVRLPPGEHVLAYRTKVGDPLTTQRVSVSGARVQIEVGRDGLTLE